MRRTTDIAQLGTILGVWAHPDGGCEHDRPPRSPGDQPLGDAGLERLDRARRTDTAPVRDHSAAVRGPQTTAHPPRARRVRRRIAPGNAPSGSGRAVPPRPGHDRPQSRGAACTPQPERHDRTDRDLASFVHADVPELAVAVLPGLTGAGTGRRMLESLLESAHGRYPAIALNARSDNAALHLHERLGFRVVETIVNRVGGASVKMLLDLAGRDAGSSSPFAP